ncbi:MAG: Rne/Rng family ribonuclease [Alphaproteobacteria bacterium]|nr:Rne/Rng family ribonuclease [Alphaproteobacteria bacterium]
MVKRMLIDATHPEETRVVVVSGNRLEEFDYETETRKQLKGNIYLAKVTRVEPSLQAAFVDYGGNRHGFLAFNEIHPDYYRLPIADREALLADEAAEASDEGGNGEVSGEELETVGGDEVEDMRRRHRAALRKYKIQEVISRRQIVLVQVTKEERGNKGAALTTFVSLAGRYCVLMPNTPRGGGISRKITNPKDRRRLKSVLEELKLPEGLAVILRTAGMERTKAEIKRDYDYLVKRWDEIRELTMQSTAPALIHEEANLIRRSIRDIYSREIDEVLVEGEEGYRTAKDFMKILMSSHAKRVQPFKDPTMPIFHRYQVEGQIDSIHDPVVQLRSGGYIVINPTEALVAIDVNSGRATRERNIEETALRTNLEAAEEVARQLRLRDLAGLIVIDFIDMEENRNQSKVEKCLKDAMKGERARVQLGRISPFGLLEMSRQRLRPSLVEATMEHCEHCAGTGRVRSTESTALHVLRSIEEEGIRQRSTRVTVHVPTAVALYILNQKRDALGQIEKRYGFNVTVAGDDALIPPEMRIERIGGRAGDGADEPVEIDAGDEDTAGKSRRKRGRRRRGKGDREDSREDTEAPLAADTDADVDADADFERGGKTEAGEESDEDRRKKPRRRGRRGGRRRSRGRAREETAAGAVGEDTAAIGESQSEAAPTGDAVAGDAFADDAVSAQAPAEDTGSAAADNDPAAAEKPARRPRRRRTAAAKPAAAASESIAPEAETVDDGGNGGAAQTAEGDEPAAAKPKPRRRTRRKPKSDNGADKPDIGPADRDEDAVAATGEAPPPAAKPDTTPADEPPPPSGADTPETGRSKSWFSRIIE